MRKVILALVASLFVLTSSAQERVTLKAAVAVKFCGETIGVLLSSDKGDLGFVSTGELVQDEALFAAIKALPEAQRGTLDVKPKRGCPLTA